MNRLRLFFFFILISLTPFISKAQAIRINYYGYNSMLNTKEDYTELSIVPTAGNQSYYGLGYEQNLNSRIAVSLEYNNGYSWEGHTKFYVFRYYDGNAEGYSFAYRLNLPWHEFSYQSKYFFSDNSEGSAYVSSGVAMRFTTYDLTIFDMNYDQLYESEAVAINQGALKRSYTTFPISFKVGYRGNLEDWFGDYQIGISFLPGNAGKKSGNTAIDKLIDKRDFKSVYITFALAFGFGWE